MSSQYWIAVKFATGGVRHLVKRKYHSEVTEGDTGKVMLLTYCGLCAPLLAFVQVPPISGKHVNCKDCFNPVVPMPIKAGQSSLF